MKLQDIVELSEEIQNLRKARDLLRSVQWTLNERNAQFSKEQIDDINNYFIMMRIDAYDTNIQ